jgi:hypothetical protein
MLTPEVVTPATQGIDLLTIVSGCLLLLPAGGVRYHLELVYVRSWITVDLVTMRCRRGQGSALAGFANRNPAWLRLEGGDVVTSHSHGSITWS